MVDAYWNAAPPHEFTIDSFSTDDKHNQITRLHSPQFTFHSTVHTYTHIGQLANSRPRCAGRHAAGLAREQSEAGDKRG